MPSFPRAFNTEAGLSPPLSLDNPNAGPTASRGPSRPVKRPGMPGPSRPATLRQAPEPPDGAPQAKRPLNRKTIRVADTGMRVMTIEESSAAYVQFGSPGELEEGLAASVFSCVDHNWDARGVLHGS